MSTPSKTSPEPQVDGRDGRVVGENKDSLMESIGKSIVAPLEGADDDADTNPDRPFSDLTKTLPQGEKATDDPTLDKRRDKAR